MLLLDLIGELFFLFVNESPQFLEVRVHILAIQLIIIATLLLVVQILIVFCLNFVQQVLGTADCFS